MATQTNLLGYFGKVITTKRKSQSDITSFFKKADRNQKNHNNVVYVRGKKELGPNNSNCMIEQIHDFNTLLTSYENTIRRLQIFNLNFNRVNSNGNIKIPVKSLPNEGSKKFGSATC